MLREGTSRSYRYRLNRPSTAERDVDRPALTGSGDRPLRRIRCLPIPDAAPPSGVATGALHAIWGAPVVPFPGGSGEVDRSRPRFSHMRARAALAPTRLRSRHGSPQNLLEARSRRYVSVRSEAHVPFRSTLVMPSGAYGKTTGRQGAEAGSLQSTRAASRAAVPIGRAVRCRLPPMTGARSSERASHECH